MKYICLNCKFILENAVFMETVCPTCGGKTFQPIKEFKPEVYFSKLVDFNHKNTTFYFDDDMQMQSLLNATLGHSEEIAEIAATFSVTEKKVVEDLMEINRLRIKMGRFKNERLYQS